jgi:hypothetical protein
VTYIYGSLVAGDGQNARTKTSAFQAMRDGCLLCAASPGLAAPRFIEDVRLIVNGHRSVH